MSCSAWADGRVPETIRPCIGVPARAIPCGQPARGGRCEEHRRLAERDRHNDAYDDPDWRRLSRRTLARHRAECGDWCPGYQVAGHPSRILTADHPIEMADGGALIQDPDVLCPACNTRKKNRRKRAVA